jgi:hypothetical protein
LVGKEKEKVEVLPRVVVAGRVFARGGGEEGEEGEEGKGGVGVGRERVGEGADTARADWEKEEEVWGLAERVEEMVFADELRVTAMRAGVLRTRGWRPPPPPPGEGGEVEPGLEGMNRGEEGEGGVGLGERRE